MRLELYEKRDVVAYEVEFDHFREAYDLLAWVGGYAGFYQYSGKEKEVVYETFIRNKDHRVFCYDAQKESGTIEVKLLDDLLAVITL